MQGIYRIFNLKTGDYYVGSTNSLKKRWMGHRSTLRGGVHHNTHLQYAWNKYGEDSFLFEIVEEVQGDNGTLLEREQIYLNEGLAAQTVYNLQLEVAGGMRGRHHTEEAKRKITEALIGRTVSEETRLKISKAHVGMRPTEETRQKLSATHMGQKPWNKGKSGVYSKEALRAMSNSHKGRELSEEHVRNICKALTGRKATDKTRRAIGDAHSKSYPAFYNETTGKYIPAGRNLAKMCRREELNYRNIYNLKTGETQSSQDGWVLHLGGR